jgi:hypothetical protein
MKRIESNLSVVIVVAIVSCLLAWLGLGQGSLTPPPGPPAPVFKTLQQVEPRTPISALPFTITQPGSYYVTANLMPASDENGIVVAANDVTIDLGGFTLTGGGGSSGEGISASEARANIVIRNGTVRGWPGSGVNFYDSSSSGVLVQSIHAAGNTFTGIGLRNNSRATDCVAEGNSSYGILVGTDCLIERCRALSNSGAGIKAGNGFTIVDCNVTANGMTGIHAATGGTIRGCTARANTSDGIATGSGSTVRDCSAQNNTGRGVSTGDGSTVVNCTAFTNFQHGIYGESGCTIQGCTARGSNAGQGGGVGIRVDNDSTVVNCTVSQNTGDGIQFISRCLILNNVSNVNNSLPGTVIEGFRSFDSGNRIEGNLAAGNGDYGINAHATGDVVIRNTVSGSTNNYGPQTGPNIGPLGSPGTATSPWANFSY